MIRIYGIIVLMFVCICNAVTERQIRLAAAGGVTTLHELTRRTGCADCCGTCADEAERVLQQAVVSETRGSGMASAPESLPRTGSGAPPTAIPLFRTALGAL